MKNRQDKEYELLQMERRIFYWENFGELPEESDMSLEEGFQ